MVYLAIFFFFFSQNIPRSQVHQNVRVGKGLKMLNNNYKLFCVGGLPNLKLIGKPCFPTKVLSKKVSQTVLYIRKALQQFFPIQMFSTNNFNNVKWYSSFSHKTFKEATFCLCEFDNPCSLKRKPFFPTENLKIHGVTRKHVEYLQPKQIQGPIITRHWNL